LPVGEFAGPASVPACGNRCIPAPQFRIWHEILFEDGRLPELVLKSSAQGGNYAVSIEPIKMIKILASEFRHRRPIYTAPADNPPHSGKGNPVSISDISPKQ